MKSFYEIVFASSLLCAIALCDPLSDDIIKYFNSDLVTDIRREWDIHRKSVENTLKLALLGNVKDSLKRYNMKPTDLRLSLAYYHKQGPVDVLFGNLDLKALPATSEAYISLPLESNLLKIQCKLTRMEINAEYTLMRNRSTLLNENEHQHQNTPFLHKKIDNKGTVTIKIGRCYLTGHLITRLKGGTVVLGRDKLSLIGCKYTVEIYNNNSRIYTVHYSVKKPAHSIGIKHFLLRGIKNKFISILQNALMRSVNTSAIFGDKLPLYEREKMLLFNKTLSNLTSHIERQNQQIIYLNGGTVPLSDFYCSWDYTQNENVSISEVKLSKMILSELGTAKFSATGGPYMGDAIMIGEQKTFRELNVHGKIYPQNLIFSVILRDFAMNIDINIDDGRKRAKIEVLGCRYVKFEQKENVTNDLQVLIIGYLLEEVPRAVVKTMAASLNMKATSPVFKTYELKIKQNYSLSPVLSENTTNKSKSELNLNSNEEMYTPLSMIFMWYNYFFNRL